MTELNTDICMEGLTTDVDASDLDGPLADGFAMPTNRFYLQRLHASKAHDKLLMRRMRRMIQPENAMEVIHHLPETGESLHAVVRGDFVMCDLLGPLLASAGFCRRLFISSLGMSVANAQQIKGFLDAGTVGELVVLVSHYFSQVDKLGTFLQCKEVLGDRLHVARNHAKLFLLDGERACYVVEGSANLRSSGCIEQFAIHNDRALFHFHAGWIREVTKGGSYR